MKRIVLLGILLGSLAGCSGIGDRLGWGKNRQAYDGQFYRASAKADRASREHFVVSVSPVSASFDGAVEAGHHEAVKHCIRYFGTSDIDWEVGPDTPREALPIEGDTLNFRGECLDQAG